jgi:hypothetical protein
MVANGKPIYQRLLCAYIPGVRDKAQFSGGLGDAFMIDIDGAKSRYQAQGLKAGQGACSASVGAAVPGVLPLCEAWRIA